LLKRIRQGHKSICDPLSENYDQNLLVPRPQSTIVNQIIIRNKLEHIQKNIIKNNININQNTREYRNKAFKEYRDYNSVISERIQDLSENRVLKDNKENKPTQYLNK